MELFDWIYKLGLGASKLNIPDITTLVIVLLCGWVGALLMIAIFRTLSLKFLGNFLFGIIGGWVGAYLFLVTVFEMTPHESSLVTFDNDPNFALLFGCILGGLLGGFLFTFVIGLLKNIVFGSKEG